MQQIDLSQVPADTPPATDIGVGPAPQSATNVDLSAAASPPLKSQPGITAEKMTETAAAGVVLTKLVLGIVASSIVLLTVYLFVMDLENSAALDRAYRSVIHQATVGPDFPDPAHLDRVRKRLAQALSNKDAPQNAEDDRDSLILIAALARLPTITEIQRDDLRRCILPGGLGSDREAMLRRCVDTLTIIQQGGISATANLEKMRLLTDFAKEVNEHRQTFRTFWLQLAQLILLNLLLPLLTALLGYIFGTTQTGRRTNDASS